MNESYYRQLLEHLTLDIEDLAQTLPRSATLLEKDLKKALTQPADHWPTAYADVAARITAALDSAYSVADPFPTMREFWSRASLQDQGKAPGTYWDTYENGSRRRLEQFVAQSYRSENALLLNSGMSAIACVLGALLSPGDVLLTTSRGYFETTDLLEGVLQPQGVKVVRTNVDDGDVDLPRPEPTAVLVETVLNAPGCAMPNVDGLTNGSDNTVVVDATFTGWSFDFADICAALGSQNVVVVESGTKYLTREASVGVVYAPTHLDKLVRTFARRTGQQLQGRALNAVRRAEIQALRARMAVHAENVDTFCANLEGSGVEVTSGRSSATAQPHSRFAPLVQKHGGGSMVFVTPAQHAPHLNFDRVLDAWVQQVGQAVEVRAGFGWDRTTGRSYAGRRLNQADAPEYLRVSVGLEKHHEIEGLAASLTDVLRREARRA